MEFRKAPELSIVIPIHNEESILREAIDQLRAELAEESWSYELILAENGSVDKTASIAAEIASQVDNVCTFSIASPNYGRALREGIDKSTGTFVVCDEIDLCNIDFYREAVGLLQTKQAQMVIGSKAMVGATDSRPWMRRLATRVMSGLLRVTLDFRGTDTHGLKAFDRRLLQPVVQACVVEQDLFASELVIRASRADIHVREIPVHSAEKRRTAIHVIKRVPRVVQGLVVLTYAIRFRDR